MGLRSDLVVDRSQAPRAVEGRRVGARQVLRRLASLLLFGCVVSIASLGFLSSRLSQLDELGAARTSAGLQRLFVQRYADQISEALRSEDRGDQRRAMRARAAAHRLEAMLEENFSALNAGGELITSADGDHGVRVDGMRTEQSRAAIATARRAFHALVAFAKVAQQKAASTVEERQLEHDALLEHADAAVRAQDKLSNVLQADGEKVRSELRLEQQLALLVTLLCFVSIAVYTYVQIARPLAITASALSRTATRLRAVLSNVFDGVVTIDEKGTILSCNRATETMFGYSFDELLGSNIGMLMPPAITQRDPQLIERTLARGGGPMFGKRVELIGMRKAGGHFPVELGLAEIEADGERLFVCTLHDVTVRKEAEEALRRRRDELQTMVEEATEHVRAEAATIALLQEVAATANEAATLHEAVGRVLPQVCRYMKWPLGHVYFFDPDRGDLRPSRVFYLGDEEIAERFQTVTLQTRFSRGIGLPGQVLASAKPMSLRGVTRHPDLPRTHILDEGESMSGFAFPVIARGQVVAVVETFTRRSEGVDDSLFDLFAQIGRQVGLVAAREQDETKLVLAMAEAMHANELKSEFLSNMSHELRTPLHAILGYTTMSIERLDGGDKDRIRKYMHNVQAAGTRLLGLLNDLLDLAKMEAGKLRIDAASTDFNHVIDQAVNETASLLTKKQIRTERSLQTGDAQTFIDRGRLVQVLINLLSNAIKFSPEGSVITIALSDDDLDGQPALACRVSDQGVGIPDDELETVFEKFVQSSTTKTGAGGTGLGLAICRQIVEAHGGRIWAEVGEPTGTVMVMLLPRSEPVEASDEPRTSDPTSAFRPSRPHLPS